MTKVRCKVCLGGKKIYGFGSVFKDCEECKGSGSVSTVAKVDKRSKEYREKEKHFANIKDA